MSEITSYPAGVPSWIDLATTDPAGARAFYGGLLGWTFDVKPDDPSGYTACEIRDLAVAGMPGQPVTDFPPSWTTYIATDDAEAAAERIVEAGGSLVWPAMEIPDSGTVALAHDPDGARFGLWQAGKHIGAAVVNEPGAMIWNELVTPDLDRAQAFYTAVCGYTWDDIATGPDGPAYRTFAVDGRTVGGVLEDPGAAGGNAQWIVYFAVEDCDVAAARAAELGGTVRVPPADTPFGRLAALVDPQGAPLAVIASSPATA